jgi:hypothetical protein
LLISFPDRHPDHKEGVNHINTNTTVLPEHLFIKKITLMDNKSRRKAVYELHNTPIAGHPGIANTWAHINTRYEGEGLKQFVEQYIKGWMPYMSNNEEPKRNNKSTNSIPQNTG